MKLIVSSGSGSSGSSTRAAAAIATIDAPDERQRPQARALALPPPRAPACPGSARGRRCAPTRNARYVLSLCPITLHRLPCGAISLDLEARLVAQVRAAHAAVAEVVVRLLVQPELERRASGSASRRA